MAEYQFERSPEFTEDYKKVQKNFELVGRLKKKINEIVKNPSRYKPLRNVLKNKRRVHIGSFVLIFEVIEAEKLIIFHRLQHHNDAYKQAG